MQLLCSGKPAAHSSIVPFHDNWCVLFIVLTCSSPIVAGTVDGSARYTSPDCFFLTELLHRRTTFAIVCLGGIHGGKSSCAVGPGSGATVPRMSQRWAVAVYGGDARWREVSSDDVEVSSEGGQ